MHLKGQKLQRQIEFIIPGLIAFQQSNQELLVQFILMMQGLWAGHLNDKSNLILHVTQVTPFSRSRSLLLSGSDLGFKHLYEGRPTAFHISSLSLKMNAESWWDLFFRPLKKSAQFFVEFKETNKTLAKQWRHSFGYILQSESDDVISLFTWNSQKQMFKKLVNKHKVTFD